MLDILKLRSHWIFDIPQNSYYVIRVLEYKLKGTYALVKQRKLKNFASRKSQESNKDNTVIPNII